MTTQLDLLTPRTRIDALAAWYYSPHGQAFADEFRDRLLARLASNTRVRTINARAGAKARRRIVSHRSLIREMRDDGWSMLADTPPRASDIDELDARPCPSASPKRHLGINNTHIRPFAKLFVAQHPDLKPHFQFREPHLEEPS